MAEVISKTEKAEQLKVVSVRVKSEYKLACILSGIQMNPGQITEGIPHTPWLNMQVAAGLVEILK